MIAFQTWENVISYIKLGLGAKVMKLEYSDDELVEIINEHVIPFYSKYDKHMIYYKFTRSHLVNPDSPVQTYQFDDDFNYKILDIEGKIDINSLWDDYNVSQFATSSGDITDYLALKNYQHIYEMIQPVDNWKFMPPNQIQMIMGNSVMSEASACGGYGFIACVNTVHKTPLTMEPTYYDYFKDLCLAKIKIVIGNIRTKFEDFSTPQGQIRINGTELKNEGEALWDRTIQAIENTPPDKFVEFF